jgi:PAS domain S-box-containing protein
MPCWLLPDRGIAWMSSEGINLIESVFAGSSEMAALMRELDWSATVLGPVEQWPHALRTSVRIVLNSGCAMSICWGTDFAFLYNDGYMQLIGTKHPWALGRPTREVIPEALDLVESIYTGVVREGKASFLADLPSPVIRSNYLEDCYFTNLISPLPDDSGSVGGVLATVLETTERVLEERRRHLLSDLASRAAGGRTEEEVWRVSAEILGENRQSLPFAYLYEYRPSKRQAYLVGASAETAEALHPPIIECGGENLWRFDPALTKDGVLVELGNRASGVPVPNWPDTPKEACVVPIRLGEYGETLGFLVAGIHPGRAFDDAYRQFVYRINEQITIGLVSAHAYEQERRRAEALAELDRAKTAFFSNVSHEFRTPLTLMLGPLEEVQKEASERLSPERQELLVTVHRNGLRLLKLVNTLLDFSRIEAGRVQASYQPTDLAHFTTEIASAFDSAMQNAGLRFSVQCLPIADPVYVDRDMWEKIVLNLLSNAYKFTLAGEVALTLKPVDGMVELQVRDTGAGIPGEHVEHVFERFHSIRSTQARTYEGTGIGLALVQELVKLHGGSVRVKSAVGIGSTFTLTIPSGKGHLPAERIQAAQTLASTTTRAEAYVEEARRWSADEPGVAVEVAMLGKRPWLASPPQPKAAENRELIVVADDNGDMRQYLARLLSERYEVHAVVDGRQALEATQRLRPALVLADVMMPHLDGFGLLRAIRGDSALAGTPVVLLSARAGEESRVEGLEADADDYLIKPFAARELLARVATHVKMSNLRRETAEREERMRGEAELEREKLRASEERLMETSRLYGELQRADAELQLQVELLQQLPVSAWTLNLDGTPDFVNRVWLEFAGQTLAFIRSHPEAWMTVVHPEDREAAARIFWEGVHSGRGFAIETRSLRAQDGTYRWHLQQAVVLRDAEGNALKFVGTTTDIDDQKRAEEALRLAQGDLARINRVTTMGELAASLAHELSQPISGAMTNTGTCLRSLEREEPDLDVVRRAVTRMARDVGRANEIIARIRAQFEKGTASKQTFDVNEIIPETVALLRDEAVRHSILVRTELSADLPRIVGDRLQLQQVTMNLILNSIEALKDVDGIREINIRSQRVENEQILISFSDTGIGISPQIVEQIFDPFFTTKPQGTGMGLRISRSIVESHGGRLWAISRPGRGATFQLTLPSATP